MKKYLLLVALLLSTTQVARAHCEMTAHGDCFGPDLGEESTTSKDVVKGSDLAARAVASQSVRSTKVVKD